jgi:hypothetical protein
MSGPARGVPELIDQIVPVTAPAPAVLATPKSPDAPIVPESFPVKGTSRSGQIAQVAKNRTDPAKVKSLIGPVDPAIGLAGPAKTKNQTGPSVQTDPAREIGQIGLTDQMIAPAVPITLIALGTTGRAAATT